MNRPKDSVKLYLSLMPCKILSDDVKCALKATFLLPTAATRFFVDLRYPLAKERIAMKRVTRQLADDVQRAFRTILNETKWLDETSRNFALKKLEELEMNIAFPEFIFDTAKLDAYHANLHLDANRDSYTEAIEKINTFNNYLKFSLINNPFNRTNVGAYYYVIIAGAYYYFNYNSVNIPAGIVREPFFSQNFDSSVNFGNLGFVIAHEISHTFGLYGISFGAHGEEHDWLSNISKVALRTTALCFVNQYDQVEVLNPVTNTSTPMLNGYQTINENLADNSGIQVAYRAFLDHLARHGEDKLHKTSSNMTQEQLFFVSYAQMWCKAEPDELQSDDKKHASSRQRVNLPLRNFPAFGKAFNCRPGSAMAPVERCEVW